MRNRLKGALALALALAGGAAAQDRRYGDRGYGDRRYEDRGQREPLDRVRADLDRAARDMRYLSDSEYRRFNKVREEIGEFQRKWERGQFSKGELNDVIASLQRVVDKNRLHARDRDLLLDDLARLRDFRARNQSRAERYR